MNDIKVSKANLIRTLKTNRATHIAEHAEALHGWQQRLSQALRAASEEVLNATDPMALNLGDVHYFNHLSRPPLHSDDYDQALGMLEWSQDDVIELSEEDFRRYVMNDWAWTAAVTQSNSMYTGRR